MDYTDIKNKTEKELHDMLIEQRNKLRDLRFRAGENQLKDVRGIRKAKKAVAKILTALKLRVKLQPQKAQASKEDTK